MEETTQNLGGRPTDYTKDLADRICEEIGLGRSLRTIVKDENMPAMASIFRWLRLDEGFREQYDVATKERAQAQHENLLDLGDEAIDLAQTVDPKASGAVVSAVKLKADNMKWAMSKTMPKKYGDKVDVTSGGEKIQGNTIVFKDFADENTK